MKTKSSKAVKRNRTGRTTAPAVDTLSAQEVSEFLESASKVIESLHFNAYACINDQSDREKHRNKYNDIEWAAAQPKGPPKYKVGDVVEFCVGGFGLINKVKPPNRGWPSEYATEAIPGMRPHKNRVSAWHYEGDFKRLVAKSPLHSLQTKTRPSTPPTP